MKKVSVGKSCPPSNICLQCLYFCYTISPGFSVKHHCKSSRLKFVHATCHGLRLESVLSLTPFTFCVKKSFPLKLEFGLGITQAKLFLTNNSILDLSQKAQKQLLTTLQRILPEVIMCKYLPNGSYEYSGVIHNYYFTMNDQVHLSIFFI